MGQHKIPVRAAQIQKTRSEPSIESPVTKQIKATVIGFSRPDCKICFGRGRLGFDARYKDKTHIIPCKCVEFFDLETVQKSWEEARAENQKKIDAEFAKMKDDSQAGELCSTESETKPSLSLSPSEGSNSSSGESANTST